MWFCGLGSAATLPVVWYGCVGLSVIETFELGSGASMSPEGAQISMAMITCGGCRFHVLLERRQADEAGEGRDSRLMLIGKDPNQHTRYHPTVEGWGSRLYPTGSDPTPHTQYHLTKRRHGWIPTYRATITGRTGGLSESFLVREDNTISLLAASRQEKRRKSSEDVN